MTQDPIMFPVRSPRCDALRHRMSRQTKRTFTKAIRARHSSRPVMAPHELAMAKRGIRWMSKDELRQAEDNLRFGWMTRRASHLAARRELMQMHRMEEVLRMIRELGGNATSLLAAVRAVASDREGATRG